MATLILYIFGGLAAAACGVGCLYQHQPLALAGLLLAVLHTALGAVSQAQRARQKLNRQGAQLCAAAEEIEALRLQAASEARHTREQWAALQNKLAHSLRIPISIIQGYADILSGGLAQDEAVRREYLEKISRRTADLTRIVGDVMAEGRAGLEAPPLISEPFDLLEMLRSTAEDMNITARQHGITIRLITAEQSIPARGDESSLRRVMYNILENAIKYMGRPGAVNITAGVDGATIRVTVKDDGLGMAADEVDKVFLHGFQGSNSSFGSGTGLHLAQVLVNAHGGSMTAKSGWGMGMGLSILLPLEGPPQPLPSGEVEKVCLPV